MMDPTQAASAAPAPSQGQTVCIAAQGDGTFMVYPESAGAESAQPSEDIDAALDAARQLLEGGNGAQPGAASPNSADALFQQGFKQVRGNPLNRGDDGDHEYR